MFYKAVTNNQRSNTIHGLEWLLQCPLALLGESFNPAPLALLGKFFNQLLCMLLWQIPYSYIYDETNPK